jgi:hypothetical protein
MFSFLKQSHIKLFYMILFVMPNRDFKIVWFVPDNMQNLRFLLKGNEKNDMRTANLRENS